jgi:hypothetical protein
LVAYDFWQLSKAPVARLTSASAARSSASAAASSWRAALSLARALESWASAPELGLGPRLVHHCGQLLRLRLGEFPAPQLFRANRFSGRGVRRLLRALSGRACLCRDGGRALRLLRQPRSLRGESVNGLALLQDARAHGPNRIFDDGRCGPRLLRGRNHSPRPTGDIRLGVIQVSQQVAGEHFTLPG